LILSNKGSEESECGYPLSAALQKKKKKKSTAKKSEGDATLPPPKVKKGKEGERRNFPGRSTR